MAKYSYEFKLQVVQAYLDGEGGYRYLSKKYGVPSKRDIEKWVFAYKAFGKDGLMLQSICQWGHEHIEDNNIQ